MIQDRIKVNECYELDEGILIEISTKRTSRGSIFYTRLSRPPAPRLYGGNEYEIPLCVCTKKPRKGLVCEQFSQDEGDVREIRTKIVLKIESKRQKT